MIFSTAAQLALSLVPQGILEDQQSDDLQLAEWADGFVASEIENISRLWELSDDALVAELRSIRAAQSDAAAERDWDTYEGWELARYEVYAVQNNREAIADEAEQARLVAQPDGGLTHRPFASLGL